MTTLTSSVHGGGYASSAARRPTSENFRRASPLIDTTSVTANLSADRGRRLGEVCARGGESGFDDLLELGGRVGLEIVRIVPTRVESGRGGT